MKTNRFLGFIMSVAALAFAATACDDKKEDLGAPSVEVEKSEISFEKTGGTETVQVTATRDWKATTEQDWISIGPREGKGSSKAVTVEIKVMENSGLDREGSVKFDIGLDSKTLTVKQKGTGSVADMTVYKNDFDKERAVKSDNVWKTYLDSFEGWRNETGTGISSVTYASSGVSARTNDKYNSSSSSSDYQGSGMNYLWFGKEPYFEVKNITLPASTNYTLSFGAERNEYKDKDKEPDNTFKHDEFKVYVSKDGSKWVQIEYSFPAGDKNKRWDLASSTFTVPDGTSALYLYFMSTKASVYCFDDLTLSISEKAGTVIDFSKGVDLGTGGGGGGTTTPTEGTVASIVSGKTDASVTLKDVLVTGVTNKSAVVTDATGSILVFVKATPGVKVGDKVTVTGTTGKHNGLMQITEPKFLIASSGNTVTYPDPKTIDESNVSSYKSDVVEFVTFKGKVKKNDVYYNIFIGGVTDKDLSLSYFPGDMESFVDKEITVKGYFVGGGTHYQIVAVNVDGKDITEAVENGGGNPGGGDNPGGEEGTIKWSGLSDWTVSQDKNTISLSFGAYTITATKNSGSTAPTVNSNMKDCRVYAKGTVTIATTGDAMTQIVFNLSSQGQKRLAPIASDNGNVATQQAGDKTVTWTGSSKSVTFTVGDKADFGSDGSSKAGQFDFSSIVIK